MRYPDDQVSSAVGEQCRENTLNAIQNSSKVIYCHNVVRDIDIDMLMVINW